MSAKVIPVELETGIPLAIAPREDLPAPFKTNTDADPHHAVYPRKRPELSSDSGDAVRQARLQWVNLADHSDYHHNFDAYMANKWKFPKTYDERFGITVMLAAGYVPERSIRFVNHKPKYLRLSDEQRVGMWDSGTLKIASDFSVFRFLRDHVVSQRLDDKISELEIEEFLLTTDVDKRLERGNQILMAATDAATVDMRAIYRRAHRNRLIRPNLDQEPKDMLLTEKFAFGTEARQRRVRTALRSRLAKIYEIEPVAA